MKRRKFLTLLGGAAAAWPLAARAQAPDRVRRLGVLMGLASSDVQQRVELTALTQELQKLGWADGRNIRIYYRWGDSDADRRRSRRSLCRSRSNLPLLFGLFLHPKTWSQY